MIMASIMVIRQDDLPTSLAYEDFVDKIPFRNMSYIGPPDRQKVTKSKLRLAFWVTCFFATSLNGGRRECMTSCRWTNTLRGIVYKFSSV
jgi:hypothetical protein